MTTFRAENEKKNHRALPLAFILWVVYFCYAICAALLFQQVLLPLLPGLHAGGGLLGSDSVYFDSVATKLAEEINLHGWSHWRLYPAASAAGNVGILGALYALFGHDPTLIVPVNAGIHALGGVLIYLLARELSGNKSFGTYAGIIASGLFVIFPSALNWYGQLHKDGYAIAGTLLILLTWVKALRGELDDRGWLMLLLVHFAGVALVGIARPYNLKLLMIATLLAWVVVVVLAVIRRGLDQEKRKILFVFASVVSLTGGIGLASALGANQLGDAYEGWQNDGRWQWQDTEWLPNGAERYIELAARTRAGLIEYGISENARSMVDQDIAPQNVEAVFAYLPRALQVSLLAPFPTDWFSSLSIMRLVSVAETFLCYLCLPGILLLLYYNRNPAVWACLGFSAFFLLIYGFTIANLGTLYRLRYGYLFVMVMLGVLGWMTWLERTGRLQRLRARIGPVEPDLTPSSDLPPGQRPQRNEALGRGLIVMGLTLLCFVGFFVRDVLMAHTFGLGGDLDNFFLALVIPMFIVTVLCMPLGTVFIPAYLEIKERVSLKAATTLVTSTSSWTTAVLLLICVVLFLFGPAVFPLFHLKDSITESGQLARLFDIALPILLFSGMVILGNAVLNAHGRAVLTSAAQLVVPVVAILSLVLFGERHGVQAVMYGMVVGQLLNLLIIQFYLSRQGGALWAKGGTFRFRRDTRDGIAPFMGQYLPQVASAFFISVAALVSTMLAMSLPEGAVSAFNLGNKVVLFVSGLVGTAVATVLLPYFSAMVSKNHLVEARRELSLFLLFATFVSVPISAMLYIWAEPIIRLAFEGGTFGSDSTVIVTSVMQYSVAQLPFLICNTLLLKFATATKHAIAISAMAVVGLLVNIISSMILMQYMGVAGIALGMTLSMLASTVLLTLVLVKNRHITGFDAMVMLMNWLLYVTLLVGVHFGSAPSIVATALAYLVLLTGYFKSLPFDGFARVRMHT